MNFQLVPELTKEMKEVIHAVLRGHNHTRNPDFFNTRELAENTAKPLNAVVLNAHGTVIGGLIAEGIGRQLLDMAEQEALARGCRFAYVDTMDYQAPDFYRVLGHKIAGKLENWDSRGHTKYFFTKELISD